MWLVVARRGGGATRLSTVAAGRVPALYSVLRRCKETFVPDELYI